MSVVEIIETMAVEAKEASRALRSLERAQKDHALRLMSKKLLDHQEEIIAENRRDLRGAREAGLSPAM
ncbi:MAG TPA: gamma-glutamyl-phosphate reductase, partial [Deltaproteobacteria bacterium]|nr:gamma-glutamyl-phosphate reductase [Deltaproteobacteria bacterium]